MDLSVVTSLAIRDGGGPRAPREEWRQWHLAQVFCLACGRVTTAPRSVAVFVRWRPTWRPVGAVFCIESCAATTLGDQDFANTVAYQSHSDTKNKSIRNLRSDGPTFHDGLQMSNCLRGQHGAPTGDLRLEILLHY
jgi:hypothetical protein